MVEGDVILKKEVRTVLSFVLFLKMYFYFVNCF